MDGLLILALETATAQGGVALTRGALLGGRALAEYSLHPETLHGRRLLGPAEMLLADSGLSWDDLDAVAVSRGPGSFTGLRLGMAAAQGLSLATGKPLVAVPTLTALAAQAPLLDMPVCALLDARKGQVYAALYENREHRENRETCGTRPSENGLPRCLFPERVLSPDALLTLLQETVPNTPVLCLGPGLAACGEGFSRHPLVRTMPAAAPRAALIGLCAAGLLASGEETENAPLYVRASDRELDLRRAGQ